MAALAGFSLAACGFTSFVQPTEDVVSCTLEPVTGIFAVQVDGTVLRNPGGMAFGAVQDSIPVRWPAGWQVHPDPNGAQLIDSHGKLQATAGQTVAVYAQSEDGTPLIKNGVLVACPTDVFQGVWGAAP